MIAGGVNLAPEAPVPHLVELVQEAERLGFQKCWIYDEGLPVRDPYVTMATVAGQTEKIHLGTGITNPYTRHPAITAAAIATLHELSAGRAFLGLGAGGSITLGPLGIERRKALTATREALLCTRRLLAGETVNFEGEFLTLVDARIDYVRSGIEVWLAGRGPKMLALGGELGDGVLLSFLHKELIQEYVDRVHKGAARSGNAPRICYSTMIATNEEALEAVRPHMTYRLVDAPPKAKALLGITDAETEEIRSAMIRDGIHEAARLVRDEWIRPFIVMGSVDQCAAELGELMRRYRIDEFSVPVYALGSAPSLMADVASVLEAAEATQ
ncbi:MAG: LLM class flavin-dependent oxidoreductase [Candidatus Promineifilaceae bacterium]|nr:LLM class flavin-dependent oxidoreductase [Candidatus Promineifilaceae bacterium]